MVWVDATEAEVSVKLGLLRVLLLGELIVFPESMCAQFFPVYALDRVLLKHSPQKVIEIT